MGEGQGRADIYHLSALEFSRWNHAVSLVAATLFPGLSIPVYLRLLQRLLIVGIRCSGMMISAFFKRTHSSFGVYPFLNARLRSFSRNATASSREQRVSFTGNSLKSLWAVLSCSRVIFPVFPTTAPPFSKIEASIAKIFPPLQKSHCTLGVLCGKMTPVLLSGVILQKGHAPLDSPMALGAALLAPQRQKA